jgi:hypothetical protein
MKRLLLGLLGLGVASCQHSSPPLAKMATTTSGTSGPASRGVVTTLLADSATVPPEALALLRQHDLAPLWANQTEFMKSHPTMEGFYGPTHYRISFYFSKVERDAKQPNLFHVKGLDRYKKVITPFVGTITVQTVQPFTKEMFVDADSTAQAFTAAGRFEFLEDPATKGAGKYYGKALLDFYIDQQGHLNHALALVGADEYKNPTKGCGLLFSGNQISNKTGQRNAVAFANFYGAVVPQEIKKLGLGDRSEEVNPNLAKLGWNEAWENDEWWAKSPKPSLSL